MSTARRLIACLAALVVVAAGCADDPSLEVIDSSAPTPTSSAVALDRPTPTPVILATVTPSVTDSPDEDDAADDDAAEADGDQTSTDGEPTAETEPTPTPEPEPDDAGDPTPTPADEPTAAPTATVGPTPTPLPPPTCTAGLAGPAVRFSSVAVEFDGDDLPDVFSIYGVGDEADPSEWRIRVETGAGESFDSELSIEFGALAPVQVLGGADVDGDAITQELISIVGAGASATVVAVHNRVGCEIVQTTIGGAPVAFPIGGGIGSFGGFQCLDTDANGVNNSVVAWSGLAIFEEGEGVYAIDGVEYRLFGTAFEQVGTRSVQANITEADFIYSSLDCSPVSL